MADPPPIPNRPDLAPTFRHLDDPDVPWQHAFRLTSLLPAEDVVFTLIQDGDHRLSREQDIARMLAAVDEF